MLLSEQMENQGSWLFKYRGILPIFILLIGASLFTMRELHPQSLEFNESSFETACLLISIIGFFIRIYTVGFTPANTSGRNTKEQVAEVLNTRGIYSLVRNPLYLGNFFMWLGLALLSFHFWFIVSFILLFFLYYERIIYTEEAFLRRKFSSEYIDWANKTPCIIPDFKLFVRNESQYNWKKVFLKEKTGLLSLFAIFTAYNILGKFVQGKTNYNWFLIFATLLSLLFYITLKFVQPYKFS